MPSKPTARLKHAIDAQEERQLPPTFSFVSNKGFGGRALLFWLLGITRSQQYLLRGTPPGGKKCILEGARLSPVDFLRFFARPVSPYCRTPSIGNGLLSLPAVAVSGARKCYGSLANRATVIRVPLLVEGASFEFKRAPEYTNNIPGC